MEKTTGPMGLPAFGGLLSKRPDGFALLQGVEGSSVKGTVRLYQTKYGVVISVTVSGLPENRTDCTPSMFAFHIHEGSDCSGDASGSGGHYNPLACPHPAHAGDAPPLFGNNGLAFSAFLTDRFTVREVLGRAAVLHGGPDDFATQPSGAAGAPIACGVIRPVRQ